MGRYVLSILLSDKIFRQGKHNVTELRYQCALHFSEVTRNFTLIQLLKLYTFSVIIWQ